MHQQTFGNCKRYLQRRKLPLAIVLQTDFSAVKCCVEKEGASSNARSQQHPEKDQPVSTNHFQQLSTLKPVNITEVILQKRSGLTR